LPHVLKALGSSHCTFTLVASGAVVVVVLCSSRFLRRLRLGSGRFGFSSFILAWIHLLHSKLRVALGSRFFTLCM